MAPSMDGRTFVGVRNSASGEVSDDTVFLCHEHDGVVWEGAGSSVVEERGSG